MSDQIEQAKRLSAELAERRWYGGIRIVLQGSMQAVAKKDSMDLKAGWRADVFYGKGRKPAFVMASDSAAQVLRDLAAMIDHTAEVDS